MALELAGSFSLSASAPSLTTTDEEVYLLEETKTRSSAVGSASVPSHYIKVVKDLNASVTYHQANTGGSAGTDDAWSLAAVSASSANGDSATFELPVPASNKTFQVGQVAINQDGLSSTIDSGNTTAYKVMMTVSIDKLGDLTSSCEVQRANSATGTTINLEDDAGFAQYLYFDDSSTGANDSFSQKPASAWTSGDADDVEDKLQQALSNSDVETAYATAITSTNGSINGQNVIASWSLGIDAVSASPDSSLTQHARARLGSGADPESTSIFNAGDKLIAASSGSAIGASYSVNITDFNSTSQNIVTGTVYGFFEQSA